MNLRAALTQLRTVMHFSVEGLDKLLQSSATDEEILKALPHIEDALRSMADATGQAKHMMEDHNSKHAGLAG